MMKIIKSLSIIVATVAVVSAGTYAAWSSVKTSTNNTFAGGTMELKLSKDSNMSTSATSLFTETSLAPGIETVEKTLYFKNIGSVEGKVKLNVSYVNYDTSNVGAASADDFARNLQLVSATTDGYSGLPALWASQIVHRAYANSGTNALNDKAIYAVAGGGYAPTMYGLSRATFYFENGDTNGVTPTSWPTNATHQSSFKFRLSPAAGNQYQGNGIDATLTATMTQFSETSWEI